MTPPPEFSEPRRSFVKKTLATSVSISFAGLIRAHGEEGGGTTNSTIGTYSTTGPAMTMGTYATTVPATTMGTYATTVPVSTTAPPPTTTTSTDFAIKMDGADKADGMNNQTENNQNGRHCNGFNWKQSQLNINGVSHLLTIRWKLRQNPKFPTDYVNKIAHESWEFEYEFLAQLRAVQNPSAQKPQGWEPYMDYAGQFYDLVLADAGASSGSGSSGLSTLSVTKVSYWDDKSVRRIKAVAGDISASHEFTPVDGSGNPAPKPQRKYTLVLEVRVKPDSQDDPASSITVTHGAMAAVVEEVTPSASPSWSVEFAYPNIVPKIVISNPPAGQEPKAWNLKSIEYVPKLSFVVADNPHDYESVTKTTAIVCNCGGN